MNLFPPTARFAQSCAFETDPDGDVVLLIPPPEGWFARLTHSRRPHRLQLDRLGSAVFRACGGVNVAGEDFAADDSGREGVGWDDLWAVLCRDFPGERDLERRTELFLRHLAQKGWIRVSAAP